MKKKTTKNQTMFEEGFYKKAWRMEIEEWGPGVWYSDGSLMDNWVGAGAVSIRESTKPWAYSLGNRATAGDGEMKGIQMSLEGAIEMEQEEENHSRG